MQEVERFAAQGGPVLGICNGFQVLCEAGLLPGALLPNTSLRFVCRQVAARRRQRGHDVDARVRARASSSRSRRSTDRPLLGAGAGARRARGGGQVVLRYAAGHDFNGSARDIAGVSNRAGNVVGLMPHPEHAVDPLTGSADGLALFRSAALVAA